MANAEVCSGTARMSDELRSSPKDKIEKNVGRKPIIWICLSSKKNMQNSDGDGNELCWLLNEI